MADADIIPFPTATPPAEPEAKPKAREAIGEVLREERKDQERTLAEVSEDANVSLPYLSEIERGRKEVSSDLLESVCDALGIEVADVLERSADRLRVGVDHRPELRLAA